MLEDKLCDYLLKYWEDRVNSLGGILHGWYDALNPIYNYSFTENEIKKWFEEEGFIKIKISQKYSINIQGQFGGKNWFSIWIF